MTQYLYPQNLKATANLWLWGLRDFCIIGIAALLSVVMLVYLRIFIPAAITLVYGFLTSIGLSKLGSLADHYILGNKDELVKADTAKNDKKEANNV